MSLQAGSNLAFVVKDRHVAPMGLLAMTIELMLTRAPVFRKQRAPQAVDPMKEYRSKAGCRKYRL